MPVFQYVALNGEGSEVHGSVEATDQRAAAASLRQRAMYVVRLTAAPAAVAGGGSATDRFAPGGMRRYVARFLPITKQDRVLFLRQLGLMLRTGLTLLQALEVCRDQTLKPHFARTIDNVADSVQEGDPLSEALAKNRRFFPAYLVKLVESAEASGELDVTMERAAEHLERRAELQNRVLTSLFYPCIVVATSIGVAAFLVLKVIPTFAKFFERRGATLPWATQFLVDLSAWLLTYGLYILAALLIAIMAFALTYASPRGRMLLHRIALHVPVVGDVLMAGAMAQLSQTLAMLLTSGVTLLDSLRISGEVIGNRAISTQVSDASDKILRGQNLATALRGSVIAPLVTQVAAVGERTGALSEVLDELSQFYHNQLQAKIRRMSALIEPVMILVIGGMVGFVYFAFFQAVLQLATGGR